MENNDETNYYSSPILLNENMRFSNNKSKINSDLMVFFGELIGTYILIMFGLSSVAQVILNKDNGGSLSIHIGWFLGVFFGVCVSGRISGAHLNPAVSLSLTIFKDFPKRKMLIYWLGQFCGAFIAAANVYLIYLGSFEAFGEQENHNNIYKEVPGTASIFCTFPWGYYDFYNNQNKQLSLGYCFISEFFGTFFLIMINFAIGEDKNIKSGSIESAFYYGLVVLGIGCCFGQQTGYAINPARDFGPRIFIFFAGWGNQVFSYGNYYFWIPLLIPLIGGVLGGGLYHYLILFNNKQNENEKASNIVKVK